MANRNKINLIPFYREYIKDNISWKKKEISCKNNIGIIRNLEINERSIHFLSILKLFKISGFQTKFFYNKDLNI